MDLVSWAELSLKHQDLLKQEINSIERQDDRLVVKKKSCVEEWLLEEPLLLDDLSVRGIFCLNTEKNLQTLIKKWSSLKESEARIVFANPDRNERWMIVPAHHARVADKKTLKAGLESMANTITRV